MMQQRWLNWIVALALIALFLIAIPVKFSDDDDSPENTELMFQDYIKKFNKTYKLNTTEYILRLQNFAASLKEINRLNSLSRGPDERKARFGLTHLSDLSAEEYKTIHLSDERMVKTPAEYNRSWHHHEHRQNNFVEHLSNDVYSRKKRAAAASLPTAVDWRINKVIGAVKNQGLCGACWAFSTIGTMEAMAAINTGKLEPLSVQEVIDCAGLGNKGCAGGDICLLLDWLAITKTPVEKDSEYPLRLTNGVCKLMKNVTGVRLKSYTCDSLVGAEDKILQALATHGPVAVAVNALTWQNYLGGVIQYHCSGAPADLNHAVELVGYDLTATVPYYIAKNSWGTEFGNNGYIHLGIGTNVCGLANEVATVDVM